MYVLQTYQCMFYNICRLVVDKVIDLDFQL